MNINFECVSHCNNTLQDKDQSVNPQKQGIFVYNGFSPNELKYIQVPNINDVGYNNNNVNISFQWTTSLDMQ
jgi:hypothetical protein